MLQKFLLRIVEMYFWQLLEANTSYDDRLCI